MLRRLVALSLLTMSLSACGAEPAVVIPAPAYDPHTSGQLNTDLVSLTVIGPNIYEADRYATAAFAMGNVGIMFIERLDGFEGYAINRHGQATYTSKFARYVKHDQLH